MRQTDADAQFNPRYRRQVGDPLLHLDGCVKSFVSQVEDRDQSIGVGFHDASTASLHNTPHAPDATIDCAQRFGIFDLLAQK